MNKRPRLIVIAGPNGSGKSTLTARLMKSDMDFGVYINPDDIAKTLTGNDYEMCALRNMCPSSGFCYG